MADFESGNLELEGERSLVFAAQHIAKVLQSKRDLTDEEKKVLADLRAQLSALSLNVVSHKKDEKIRLNAKIEQLDVFQEKIMSWEADQSILWEAGRDEVFEYMNAVHETQQLIEELESFSSNEFADDKIELLRRGDDVLQTAMVRLEDEFRHLLLKNKCSFEPETFSFQSSEEDSVDKTSMVSFGASSFNELAVNRESMSRTSEDTIIDLVNPDVIPELKLIASSMFKSNYGHECSQAYIHVQKDTLQECMLILEMERHSIEDVLKMDWPNLYSMIKRWVRVIRIFVRVYLRSERSLSDEIFGEMSLSLVCFVEASKAAMLQLLNFGEAVSIGPHQPEKLFCILDMYEIMVDLKQDIDDMYSGDVGSSVRIEYQDVLNRLGEYAALTFLEFKRAIASNSSTTSFASGGIHPLTRYVMNYLNTLTDYDKTLELLHRDRGEENSSFPLSPDVNSLHVEEEIHSNGEGSNHSSQMTLHFHGFASILQSNLMEKARLYKDIALHHLFLMNNIHYMAEKVKNSESLRPAFGDEWIKKQNWKFQQHALNYQRTAWGPILSLLKDEGLINPGSNSISKTILKERFRSFSVAFDELYKAQTAWLIPDLQLREELRISISSRVSQAYRTFVGRHSIHVGDKHIKYSADDLENYLLDLFEGSPKSLQNNPHRR